ncbi:MAG: hypothetical protein Q7J98_07440 [Kiritimatiellia bacterium]|nr:hypothetical protein [Kiritimatiellia bacterium]
MLYVFFMWCTIINYGLLILMSLILISAGDWIHRLHSKWFPMPKETFNVVIYSFLGVYKIGVIIFNLVPFVALLIMK